ncbi:MAG TPA: hypothetical protein VIS06_15615 [Mycobacteriales bacterium]
MADQLASPDDLTTLLGEPSMDVDLAVLLVETATGVVQGAAGGQRIVEVVDDTVTVMGTSDRWLALPQVPVTAVSSVTVDGSAVTDWKRFGSRLWRRCGWAAVCGEPSEVVVVCTHGYAPYAQELQLARKATLGLAAAIAPSPGGVQSEAIDDYKIVYAAAAEREMTEPLRKALRKQYGRRGGTVSLR